MEQKSASNKRIAKNTLFLYFRMLFLMFITFFTSRIVLDKLGVVDFGIQNVVGGLASMFIFFRSSLSNATQRYLSIAIGEEDFSKLKRAFCQHQTLYIGFALVVVILCETIGLWILYNKLIVPEGRFDAAFYVFQLTIVGLCTSILNIVYDSVLIAHEDFKVYSYIGIAEGIAKLSIAFAISFSPFDRLVSYSFLLALVRLIVLFFYSGYCKSKYKESYFHFEWDCITIKQTAAFISWNIVGTAVWAINEQGINILLNMFFGPVINAARSIALLISDGLNSFVNNFLTAVRPQMIKSYATGQRSIFISLLYTSSLYSVLLMWILTLPILLDIDVVLSIWLKEVPHYSADFGFWILLFSLVNTLNGPLWISVIAIGKLKWYTIVGNTIYLMTFPIAYVILKMGMSPISVFVVSFIVRCIYIATVVVIVAKIIQFSMLNYFRDVLWPLFKVITLTSILSYLIAPLFPKNLGGLICLSTATTGMIAFSIWNFTLSTFKKEKIRLFLSTKIREINDFRKI